jgi:hypothetical protein
MGVARLLIEVNRPCEESIRWAQDQLAEAGFRVLRTFDLQKASLPRPSVEQPCHTEFACTHQVAQRCDFQMVVLLVYGTRGQPASLVAQCSEGKTSFFLIEAPDPVDDPQIELTIQNRLLEHSPS